MNWFILAFLCACLYGVYNFFIKVASGSINQVVGAVILQIVAAIVGSLVLLVMKLANQPLMVSRQGFFWAALAGLGVGLAEITYFYMFSRGVNASIGIPVVVGGTVLISSCLGIILKHEPISDIRIIGIILIVTGISLVSK